MKKLILICILFSHKIYSQEIDYNIFFKEESVKIGDTITLISTLRYPKNIEIIQPDSSYKFIPFEFLDKIIFESSTSNNFIYDSTIYLLQTFELDSIQSIYLKSYIINTSDSLEILSNNDDILTISLVNEKNSKIKGYVLDLRNNPGGLLTQAINITDFFLEDGEIVSTKGRKVSETRKFFARKGDEIKGKPIIVLINNGSASASEIFAGALKDHKRAIILGENSYGKGSVQSIIPLRNGGGMRLTISKYYLPSGKSISEVGVTPDILVEEKGEDFLINSEKDNQLNYAIKLFNS